MNINSEVSGYSENQFEPLRKAFLENFDSRGEIGGAIALQVDGKHVVSLWGGWQDRESEIPWAENTLSNVYSTTKGVAATIIAILVSEGRLRYQDKVIDYWPEFVAGGKESVTVGMLMSHQAGLSGFREPASVESFYDSRAAAATLGSMTPLWTPGEGFGYHPISIGFLVDELCHRLTGKSVRDLVQKHLTQRYHNGIYIGCPQGEQHRAATLYRSEGLDSTDVVEQEQALTEMQMLALGNPVLDQELPNTPEWRSAVIASANGFASAQGLSALYGSLAAPANPDNPSLVTNDVLQQCCTPQVVGNDKTLAVEARWGCGFLVNSLGIYGPSERAFGHSGWGGSFAFADPDKKIGFAYVMNQMGEELIGDPRNVALIDALYQCFD